MPRLAKRDSGRKRKLIKPGKIFGRLTVLGPGKPRQLNGLGAYHSTSCCSCSCDGTKVATNASLKSGGVRSCGCLKKNQKDERSRAVARSLRRKRLSYALIGEELGVSRERVRQLLAETGDDGEIGLSRNVRKVDRTVLSWLFESGLGVTLIAERFKVSTAAIYSNLRAMGCVLHERGKVVSMIGEHRGRWLIRRIVGRRKYARLVECLCDPVKGGCGAVKVVNAYHILADRSRSCGCLRREWAASLGRSRRKTA